jgi:hypothetical protein
LGWQTWPQSSENAFAAEKCLRAWLAGQRDCVRLKGFPTSSIGVRAEAGQAEEHLLATTVSLSKQVKVVQLVIDVGKIIGNQTDLCGLDATHGVLKVANRSVGYKPPASRKETIRRIAAPR